MTRLDDMLARYGECVNFADAGRILSRCRKTVKDMTADGRLRLVCGGTMVDVRSIAEYIEGPEQAEEKARKVRRGRKWAV